MKLSYEILEIEDFKSIQKLRFDFRRPSGLYFVAGRNDIEPELESNGCLRGDTLIDCPRDLVKYPRGIPIKKLVGRKFLTYSWDAKQNTMILTPVSKVWCTGVQEVVAVDLTAYPNGRNTVGCRTGGTQKGKFLPPCRLVGTIDHLVMLTDGSWKPLGKLSPGDSLKSLYRRDADRGMLSWSQSDPIPNNFHKSQFYYPLTKTVREQQFVCTQVHGNRPISADVHHKDENKFNHSPQNLEWKNSKKHKSDHARDRILKNEFGWQKYGQHPKGMLGKKHSQQSKEKISQTLREGRYGKATPPNHVVKSKPYKIGKTKVYDMEVPETHNFIANGVVVHNSGKSSIFDALCWVQFGTTADAFKTPDLIPWGTSSSPIGKLTTLIDGKRRVIDRTSKPGRIQLDGKDITQEALEEVLRFNIETFCHTVLLPQEHDLFFDLTAGQKLSILSNTLKLDRWDERSDRAWTKATALDRDIAKAQSTITSLGNQYREVTHIKASIETKSEEWEDQQAAKQKVSDKEWKDLRSTLDKAERKKTDADLAYDLSVTELRDIRKELMQIADYIRAADVVVMERDAVIRSIKNDCNDLREQISSLRKGKCPTCGQELHTKLPKRQQLQDLLKVRQAQIDTETAALETEVKTRADLFAQQTNVRKAEEQQVQKAELARTTLDHHLPIVASLKTKLQLLEKQQKEAEEQSNPYREQLRQLTQRQTKISAEQKQIEKDKKAYEVLREQYEFWSRAFRDIKLEIIDEVLQELELCVNAQLPRIGLDGWMVEFDIERETKKGTIARGIDLTILPYRRADLKRRIKFASWSGGEAQRLRLVGSEALSDVLLRRAGVDVNLQILDEPTRGLAPRGVIHMVDFLAERAVELGRTILLADQTAIQSASFSGTVLVGRTKNGTQILNSGIGS